MTRSASRGTSSKDRDHLRLAAPGRACARGTAAHMPSSSWRRNSSTSRSSSSATSTSPSAMQHLAVPRLHPQEPHGARRLWQSAGAACPAASWRAQPTIPWTRGVVRSSRRRVPRPSTSTGPAPAPRSRSPSRTALRRDALGLARGGLEVVAEREPRRERRGVRAARAVRGAVGVARAGRARPRARRRRTRRSPRSRCPPVTTTARGPSAWTARASASPVERRRRPASTRASGRFGVTTVARGRIELDERRLGVLVEQPRAGLGDHHRVERRSGCRAGSASSASATACDRGHARRASRSSRRRRRCPRRRRGPARRSSPATRPRPPSTATVFCAVIAVIAVVPCTPARGERLEVGLDARRRRRSPSRRSTGRRGCGRRRARRRRIGGRTSGEDGARTPTEAAIGVLGARVARHGPSLVGRGLERDQRRRRWLRPSTPARRGREQRPTIWRRQLQRRRRSALSSTRAAASPRRSPPGNRVSTEYASARCVSGQPRRRRAPRRQPRVIVPARQSRARPRWCQRSPPAPLDQLADLLVGELVRAPSATKRSPCGRHPRCATRDGALTSSASIDRAKLELGARRRARARRGAPSAPPVGRRRRWSPSW